METLIENVYVDNEELLKEVTAVALKRKMLIYISVMAAFAVAFVVLGIVLENSTFFLATLVCAVMGVMLIRMPKQVAKNTYENKMAAFDEEIPATTIRFAERVYAEFNDEEVDFIYEEIKQVKILKTCIIFEGRDRIWYYTPFHTFTVGSAQELLALLEERCPHLRIPKWNG